MKKIFFTIITFMSIIQAFGQVNPIKNLTFNHTYSNPYNCFDLSWGKPDTSLTDTLIGYNIYHNDSLFMFTTNLSHSCNPCIGAPIVPFCDFMNYNNGFFDIHVTAVYNSVQVESTYNDSIAFGGIVIKVQEIKGKSEDNLTIFPNPTTGRITLQAKSLKKIEVLDWYGRIIFKSNISCNKYDIDLSNNLQGVYFIKATTNYGVIVKKIIIE